MMQTFNEHYMTYDVIGIGDAIVDVISKTTDDTISSLSLHKGSRHVIDENKVVEIQTLIKEPDIISGGSAANTMVGIQSLGGKTAFLGKVGEDPLGGFYKKALSEYNIDYISKNNTSDRQTGQCLIFITDDFERTMCTYHGACSDISSQDADFPLFEKTKYVYIEACMWERALAKDLLKSLAKFLKGTGVKVAFNLVDGYWFKKSHDEVFEFFDNYADIIIGNEGEIFSFFKTKEFSDIVDHPFAKSKIIVATQGEQGARIIVNNTVYNIPSFAVENMVDTVGAGDIFASGFLYGLAKGYDIQASGELGAKCAAQIIQQAGARPQESLASNLSRKDQIAS